MRRYLVVAHKTLGGAHLLAHLHHLREEDPYCQFHLLVPIHHPTDRPWSDGSVNAVARAKLDEILEQMAAMRMGATGGVGDANPVDAVGTVLRREGDRAFSGIILSTLPGAVSQWWLFGVPRRLRTTFPHVPVTHLVADDSLVP